MFTMGITAAYRPDHPRVSLGVFPVDGADTGPVVDVPELEGTVQGPADDARRVKLQTGDSVLVSHQRPQTRSLVVPHLSEENTDYLPEREREREREREATERKHKSFKNTIYKIILRCGIYQNCC